MPTSSPTSGAAPTDALGADERRALAAELDATEQQIDEAVAAVGPSRSDIELHLKGTRSSTTADKVKDAGV